MPNVPVPDQFQTGVPRGRAGSGGAPSAPGVRSGYLGGRYDAKLGDVEGSTGPVLPMVTLEAVRTISVQFSRGAELDGTTQLEQPDLEGTPRTFVFKTFTAPPPLELDHVQTVHAVGDVFVHPALAQEPDVLFGGDTALFISTTGSDDIQELFDDQAHHTHVRLEWDGGSTSKRFLIVASQLGGGGPMGDHVHLFCTTLSTTGVAAYPAVGQPVTLVIERLREAPDATQLYFNAEGHIVASDEPVDFGSEGAFEPSVLSSHKVMLQGPSGSSVYTFDNATDDPGLVLLISPVLVSTAGDPFVDGDEIDLIPLTPQAPLDVYPNAAARARVRTRAGQSGDLMFECDWVGGFQVHAQSIEIDYVSWRPNPDLPYVDATARLSVALSLEGDCNRWGPQYTVPPAEVATTEDIELVIPPLARRVSLLLKYGDGSTGDAPLAQLFAAFGLPNIGSLGFIDLLSSRAAAFGDGIPIPAGATKLVLTNMSPDLVSMGAVFHLGL